MRPGEIQLWRVVNANRVLGQPEHGQALVAFALEPERPLPARVEAVQILAEYHFEYVTEKAEASLRLCEGSAN